MVSPPDGRPLLGRLVRLDRAQPRDARDLFTALDDSAVYAAGYNGGRRPATPRAWADLIAQAAADNRMMYVVRRREDGQVIGTSSLGELDLANERAHLGWTAYSPQVWGSAVNPECKLLLLGHAFDDCGLGRVKIQTDAVNLRSQAAIAKLGATREGVLRRDIRRADGSFRDTVVFSVLVDEWPRVRAGLQARLAAAGDRPHRAGGARAAK